MYNLKIISSGTRVEIYKISNYVVREGPTDQQRRSKTEKEKQSIKDRRSTLNNARNNIIRLIKTNSDLDVFITLTFKEIQDYKESKSSLDLLFKRLRRHYPGLKYLWVLEYGELHNRLHYHLLCNIPVGIQLSTSKELKSDEHKQLEQEFEYKYWPYGFVDIRHLAQEDNTNIALYVSCYIVKSLLDVNLQGFRVYGYSHKTLNKPVEVKINTDESIEEILKQFPDYEISFNNSYKIGYKDHNGDHVGKVNYYDLKLKEGVNNENK